MRSPAEAVLPAFLDTKNEGPPRPTISAHEKELIELRQQIEVVRGMVLNSERRARFASPEDPMGHRLPPEPARAMIRKFLEQEAPDDFIIERLTRQGVPMQWTAREILKRRAEISSRPENSEPAG